ncbi:hypothetical protein CspHIS471_0409080 [Cutaneotrichosporon sp. HIS471]|nr:hypothetical protein CspHIS471_0409080 [Cutaneotrichosporon sp. HIS471]
MPRNYLLSRTLDPLLGVFTGFLAYYLHETNPRTAPPPGHTLKDLVSWQVAENKQRAEVASAANAAADSAELEAVRRELDDAESVDRVIQAVKSVPEAAAAPCRTCRFYVYYYSNHAWLLGLVLVL